ncbi:MAG: hypothetical protein ACI8ZO_000541 [Flavobacteriales bacterium]|jgi:hypothetical protein
MLKKNLLYIVLLATSMILMYACKEEVVINPFDDPKYQGPGETAVELNLDEGTFQYLHYYIFEPTCANSGCHDGTFEPNFTNIESSYNTLVYHDIIKNDQTNKYDYRVMPGNADLSLIIERLSGKMDGVEDQMPIVLEPGSDYDENRSRYIQMIGDWIDAGAKDMFNNGPKIGNQNPQIIGAVAFADGSNTPLTRLNSASPIEVPEGTSSLDVWIAITDDSTATQNIAYNKIKFSSSINSGFRTATEMDLQITPSAITEEGYFGSNVLYYHHIVINPSIVASTKDDIGYFRISVNDTDNGVIEIPTDGSFNYFKEYLSFVIVE